ncbi:MAG: bifunctional (p)ppGpp synthetase/guanosine-3',5'-bis(diphosphate) 3'-pyrophosphohydrolase [Muribaculaceae bacterium]|nr:bifunctional (p)ppGpp synthetase/guanosine-3',5'-bis(diphosphate) 3'-pyrophosphohydrolase [Muribaculaceae bacterium]
MHTDYDRIILERADHVFEVMEKRVSADDMTRIRAAFNLAREAHAPQKRKTGEPYILHPIAVANIAAEELMLGANPVIACFLHDVVEDTPYTFDDIRQRFGDDVAFLVRVVTKKPTHDYELSKQLDNYRQLLQSMQYDIRAILVKLADRLHNMRTLASMKPEKQMKIAGETDYFYAPLANRLGLYNIKTELENLSFRFRCPDEYVELSNLIERHVATNKENLEVFRRQIQETLAAAGITARVYVDYRRPFSLWRKMKKYGDDFNHLKYRHFVEVVFDQTRTPLSEKQMAMKIYCILTDRFKEKHCSMSNYIDSPKENGYQSLHVKLLPDFGRWQEVHISSEAMIRRSQLGCVAERNENNIQMWIEKFRSVLHHTISNSKHNERYMEDIITAFYNDDIQVFTPRGKKIILPQNATVIDFAYEVHTYLGDHARYARINSRLEPVTTPLRRGDVIEIVTDENSHPEADWENYAHTFKARKAIRRYLESVPALPYHRCTRCNPIPGEEVIGIRNHADPDTITIHKRDCSDAITMASSYGDDVVSVDFAADSTLYPVTLRVRAVDRSHLFVDLVDCITNTFRLSMESFNTATERNIVICKIRFGVHSYTELKTIINHISAIDGVDEVHRL